MAAEPAEHLTTVTGSFTQFVLQTEGKDPLFLLAEVSGGAQSAAPLGRQVVHGTATQGYLVTVDVGRAAAAASGPAASVLTAAMGFEEQALGGTPQAPAPEQAIYVWVDGSGRVVQLRASPPGSGVGTTTMTVTSFGAHVDPAPPPSSQTVDLATLVGAGDVDRD